LITSTVIFDDNFNDISILLVSKFKKNLNFLYELNSPNILTIKTNVVVK